MSLRDPCDAGPVAIVLTYRISRTSGFVHGGIAIFGALTYAVLVRGVAQSEHGGVHTDPIVGTVPALLLTIVPDRHRRT